MNRSIPTASALYFPDSPHDPATLERLEHAFFGAIRQSNGTYKYTYARRLDDLNERVSRWLPADRPLNVMDVAVSSGISTLEWSESLDAGGVEHEMTAGDLNIRAYLVTFPGGLRVLVDGRGHPLQYDMFGRAVLNPPPRRQLPLVGPGIALARLGLRRVFPEVRRASGEEHGDVRQVGKSTLCRTVMLVSPRLLGNGRIRLIEDDILREDASLRGFHVLRAANILNRAYFDDETLGRIVVNLRDRLREGGLLVVCSTTGDTYRGDPSGRSNDGTIFVRRGPDLEVVDRIGRGSAVESLILERSAGSASVAAGRPTP